MSEFLRKYFDVGLTDIVLVNHQWREIGGGSWPDEETDETVVAKKGKQFVRLTVRLHVGFGFNVGSWTDVLSEEEIGQKEYETLASKNDRVDRPAAIQQLKDEDRNRSRRLELEQELSRLAPSCPECHGRMRWRKSKYGPFWGCLAFPECVGKTNMSLAARKVYDEMTGR